MDRDHRGAGPERRGGAWRRAVRRGRLSPLAAGVLGLLAGSALLGRGDALPEGHAGAFRPGGLAPGVAAAALGRDPRAVPGCLRAGARDPATLERAELGRLFEILALGPSGRALLRRAGALGVHVCLDGATELFAYYIAGRRVVGLSRGLSRGGKLAFLAHELAHASQHPRYSDNRYFAPRDLVLLRRVREAAAEAVSTRVAWELDARGREAAWREKLAGPYGDIARAFAAVAVAGADEGALLRATRAAFDRWFAAPWRLRAYDRMTLRHLERISRDAMGLVPPRYRLRARFLADIGWLDGRNFLRALGAPALRAERYAGGLSASHARRLRGYLQRARGSPAASLPRPLVGPGA